MWAIKNKYKTSTILLASAKAFNTVNYEKFLSKLEHYGIRDTTYSFWFKSYFSSKPQDVKANQNISKTKSIT